jgi:transposase
MRQDVLTGVERRRRWSVEQKLRIVAAADVEGVNLSDVARRYDITRQHIYQWRRDLRSKGPPSGERPVFLPVDLIGDAVRRESAGAGAEARRGHAVEIGLRDGRSLRVAAEVPEATLHRLIRIVEAQ